VQQLRDLAEQGIQFHTQIVMSPGVNDGPVLQETLSTLYRFGSPILSCSVVPVGLTEYSKHHLVREPTAKECRAAVALVEAQAVRARAERGISWALGADELYLRAGLELPPAEAYDGFDQVENGVGSVRWLQQRIKAGAGDLNDWEGKRIGVVTGTAMAPLMPQVLEGLSRVTGSEFDLIAVENSLFGPRVTTAGLLPGAAIQRALQSRPGLHLVLLPGESLNDDELFIDGMSLDLCQAALSIELRPSRDFLDALLPPVPA
jgi:NifB/MoaA-like Fe-S oxidoreductase